MINKELIQISGTIENMHRLKDGTWSLQVYTQELEDDEKRHAVVDMAGKVGWFLFKMNELEPEDIIDIKDNAPVFKGDKPPHVRLRAVLFVLWTQMGKPGDFEVFYRARMEKFIDFIKEKLTPTTKDEDEA